VTEIARRQTLMRKTFNAALSERLGDQLPEAVASLEPDFTDAGRRRYRQRHLARLVRCEARTLASAPGC
jgi:hypothetical protein